MPSKFGTTGHSRARGGRRFAFGASATALLWLLSGPAFPQAAGAASNQTGGVETITVTAQFIQQNIQTTPLAVTAVTGQDLQARGINDLSQLKDNVPSLTINKTPTAFGSGVQVYIRGIGQYDTAFASEPGVGMYIDDVYYGTLFGSSLELYDLNRIEVLRGPQGVLGGKNNIGGAIRMVSQKPTGDNSGYLEGSYGSFNEVVVRGTMDVSIIPDHLFLRASALSRTQNGYVNVIDYACRFGPGFNDSGPGSAGRLPVVTTRPDCKIGTEGGTDVQGGRIALRAIFMPGMEDVLSVDTLKDNSEVQPGTLETMDNGGPNIYVNRGHGIEIVPRAQYYGLDSGISGCAPGQCIDRPPLPLANGGTVAGWNALINLPTYGIPWDQRFMGNPFKTTYATYTSRCTTFVFGCPPDEGLRYNQGAMVHSYGGSNIFDWDIFPNVHFKNITGYRFYRAANSNDSDVSPMSFQLTTSYPTNKEWQEEGRFTGTLLGDNLEWTAGGFYYHRINRQHGPVVLDALIAPFLVFEQNDKYVTNSKSVYAHAIYHIFDDLEVFGGVRYTSEDKTYYFDHSGDVPGYRGFGGADSGFFRSTVDPALSCIGVIFGIPCDHTIHPALAPHVSKTAHPDWRAGLDYHITPDDMVYFQFSTGYRTGGTNSRPFSPAQLDSFGPEKLKSYELGLKTGWFDNRLHFNAAFFLADYTDIITPLAAVDPLFPFLPYVKYVNLSSARDKGFELEATAAPIDNLLIDASFSYVDFSANALPGAWPGFVDGCTPEAQEKGVCAVVTAGTVHNGNNPILFPKEQAHLGIQYTWTCECMGSLTPRLDWNYQSTIYQTGNNNPYTAIKARGLLDGRLTWDAPTGGWEASVLVTNLTNKHYFINVFDLSIFNFGSVEAQPGTPREYLLTLRKSF